MDEDALIRWYQDQKRVLPWRDGASSWGILVSEVMLQQTPVNRVHPAWIAWMNRWPTAADLAAAPQSDVVKAWGTMGYPRRAQRLHRTAQIIAASFDNEVPDHYDTLISLPGIGDYTASAVLAFAFKQRITVLDTNVRRVLARHVSGLALPRSSSPTRQERATLDALLPHDPAQAATFSVALMELGSLICTAAKVPQCEQCPISLECQWRQAGFPKPTKRTKPQAPFAGSDRQARGMILAAARKHPTVVLADLVWPDSEQLQRAAESLHSDQLVRLHEGKVELA